MDFGGNSTLEGYLTSNETNSTLGISEESNTIDSEKVSVIIYMFLFVFGCPPNVWVFISLLTRKVLIRSNIRKLLLHLSVADLIVTCVMIPMEIGWGLTNAWKAGDIMCRVLQVIRALGPYLSSCLLVCISVDRYFAIVFPLKFGGSEKRINKMLLISWISSIVLSIPQGFIFSLQHHPHDPSFTQCIALGFFSDPWQEKAYSVFCLFPLYFIPLAAIVWCYFHIYSAARKRTKNQMFNPGYRMSSFKDASPVPSTDNTEDCETIVAHIPESRTGQDRVTTYCRSSNPMASKMDDSRRKVLRLTVILITAFILCWTPYIMMNLWYQVDPTSAQRVNKIIQNVLFLFAVSNSCINPYLYGKLYNPFFAKK